MLPAISSSNISQSSTIRLQCLVLILLLLPLTACGRYRANKELGKAPYLVEILKRENRKEMGKDEFFKDTLLGNPDAEIRLRCAVALGRIRDPRALPLLYSALHRGNADVRAAAAFAIGEIEDNRITETVCSARDPRAVMELFRLLDDSSISVRLRAVEALGKVGSSAEVPAILRRVDRFPYGRSALERAYLSTTITAFARLQNPAAIPFLEQWSNTGDPQMQKHASEARTRIQSRNDAQQSVNPSVLPDGSVEPCGMNDPRQKPETGFVTELASHALVSSRKNITNAQIETTRGTIEIRLFREDAPVTAARFVEMAKRGVYDGTVFTKTSASGLIEGGNPIEWPGLLRLIPSEINMRPFERGRLGMAVSREASDAGRFFITLSPQPYLDGTNTCFGYVVSGLQIADRLTSDDRILRITIKERISPQNYQRY